MNQKELIGTITAMQTLVDKFPMNLLEVLLSKGKHYSSALDFILDIIYYVYDDEIADLYKKIVEKISGISYDMAKSVDKVEDDALDNKVWNKIEDVTKGAIVSVLTAILGCSAIPEIPSRHMDKSIKHANLITGKPSANFSDIKEEKIVVPISAINLRGKLDINPLNEIGKTFYSHKVGGLSPNTLYKTHDLDAFIWYVINYGTINPIMEKNKMIWDNRKSMNVEDYERVRSSSEQWDAWLGSKGSKSETDGDPDEYPIFLNNPNKDKEGLEDPDDGKWGETGYTGKDYYPILQLEPDLSAGEPRLGILFPSQRYHSSTDGTKADSNTRRLVVKYSGDTSEKLVSYKRNSDDDDSGHTYGDYYAYTNKKEGNLYVTDSTPTTSSVLFKKISEGVYEKTNYDITEIKSLDIANPFILNHTMYKFNWEYMSSIRIFSVRTIIASLVNCLTNALINGVASVVDSTSASLSFNYLNEKISNSVKNIIMADDMDIEDCAFAFSNEDFDEMLYQTDLKRYNVQEYNAQNGASVLVDQSAIESAMNDINQSASAIGGTNIVEKALLDVTATAQTGSKLVTKFQFSSQYMQLIYNIVMSVINPMIDAILAPKIILLFIINFQTIGLLDVKKLLSGDATEILNILVTKIMSIIKAIIVYLKDVIVELLLEFLYDAIEPLINNYIILIAMEKIEAWKKLLDEALKCIPIFDINLPKVKNYLDDVNYADIEQTQDQPESTEGASC